MIFVAVIIVCYLIGSILVGPLLAGLFQRDLKQKGSGNPGATNAFRVIGPLAGILVLAGDALKAWLALALASRIVGEAYLPLFGLAVIAGHNWSVFHGFKGGKGIATTLGLIIVLVPKTLWLLVPGWLGGTGLTGFVSVGSVSAAVLLPIATILFYPGQPLLMVFSVSAALLAVYRHIPNIKRLVRGQENRLFGKRKEERE